MHLPTKADTSTRQTPTQKRLASARRCHFFFSRAPFLSPEVRKVEVKVELNSISQGHEYTKGESTETAQPFEKVLGPIAFALPSTPHNTTTKPQNQDTSDSVDWDLFAS